MVMYTPHHDNNVYTHIHHQVKEVYKENDSIGEDVEFYPEESTPSRSPVHAIS